MKKKDLKAGVVYQFWWDKGDDIDKISIGTVKNNGNDELGPHIYENREFDSDGYCGYMNTAIEYCKPATPKQIAWLNACIKAEKFIPLTEVKLIIDDYEMY